MLMHRLVAAVLLSSMVSPISLFGQKREQFHDADVIYDWVSDDHGDQLRTFVTRPKGAVAKVPAIFFVGWLSCDSVEYADGETDGFGSILWRLIERSGYATFRVDTPGIGESKGTAPKPILLPNYQAIKLRSIQFTSTILLTRLALLSSV